MTQERLLEIEQYTEGLTGVVYISVKNHVKELLSALREAQKEVDDYKTSFALSVGEEMKRLLSEPDEAQKAEAKGFRAGVEAAIQIVRKQSEADKHAACSTTDRQRHTVMAASHLTGELIEHLIKELLPTERTDDQ